MDLEHAGAPDMFANELIATYFSVHFLQTIQSNQLATALQFARFVTDHYHPPYCGIEAMDSVYAKMPVQNFKWFHLHILLLADDIGRSMGNDFITNYLKQTAQEKIPVETLVEISQLDSITKGLVSPWAQRLTR